MKRILEALARLSIISFISLLAIALISQSGTILKELKRIFDTIHP